MITFHRSCNLILAKILARKSKFHKKFENEEILLMHLYSVDFLHELQSKVVCVYSGWHETIEFWQMKWNMLRKLISDQNHAIEKLFYANPLHVFGFGCCLVVGTIRSVWMNEELNNNKNKIFWFFVFVCIKKGKKENYLMKRRTKQRSLKSWSRWSDSMTQSWQKSAKSLKFALQLTAVIKIGFEKKMNMCVKRCDLRKLNEQQSQLLACDYGSSRTWTFSSCVHTMYGYVNVKRNEIMWIIGWRKNIVSVVQFLGFFR